MSSTVKLNQNSFISSVRPGINTLVMKSFEKELEKELQGAVDRAMETLKESLPDKIESVMREALELDSTELNVKVFFKQLGDSWEREQC